MLRIYDSLAMRDFVGIDLDREPVTISPAPWRSRSCRPGLAFEEQRALQAQSPR
jgi:hypothetical protein